MLNFLQYPIIQAPMAGGPTIPELVSAVSNAGGLGSLGAGAMSPDEIRDAIHKIRKLTKKPFSVNLFSPEVGHASLASQNKMCKILNEVCQSLAVDVHPVEAEIRVPFDEKFNVILEEKMPVGTF